MRCSATAWLGLDKIPCLGYGVALGKRGQEEKRRGGKGDGKRKRERSKKRKEKKGNTNEYPNGPSNQHEYGSSVRFYF